MTRFLARTNSRLLKGALWEADIQPWPGLRGRTGQQLTPDMISVSEIISQAREIIAHSARCPMGDLPQSVSASFNIPWLELLCGCTATVQGDTVWAEASDLNYDTLARLTFDPGNPWFSKWLDIQRALGLQAGEGHPVSLPVMHGPLDLLSAVKGPDRLCVDLLDRPADVRQAMAGVTKIWIAAARALLSVSPAFQGGMCSRMKIWLPGPAVTLQDDATALLSPACYSEFVQPFEQKIIHSFPYHTYHSHSTSAHLLERVAGLQDLTSIQITLDPNGPPRPKLREIIEKVLQKKPVLLCVWDREWAEWCEAEFRPAGVCIAYIIRNDDDWVACGDWLRASKLI
jgi:hypothetical protein